MNFLFHKLNRFIRSLGGDVGTPVMEPLCDNLPLFVTASYDFRRATCFGRDCLIMLNKSRTPLSPEQIIAQKKLIEKRISGNILFVFPCGTREFCQNLVNAQIPFAIPGRQLFFPETIIAMREDKFSRVQTKNGTAFSPLAQVILLYHLLHKEHGNILAFQDLQTRLNLNKVYVSRSAKELEQSGIAQIAAVKRMKSLVFVSDRRTIWEDVQERLTSPVRKRIRLAHLPCQCIPSGISALSAYSMIEDDAVPTYAVYGRGFKWTQDDLREFSGPHLELWKYDPHLLTDENRAVDKLSLFLSLRDNPDPRVAGELQDMMGAFEW